MFVDLEVTKVKELKNVTPNRVISECVKKGEICAVSHRLSNKGLGGLLYLSVAKEC